MPQKCRGKRIEGKSEVRKYVLVLRERRLSTLPKDPFHLHPFGGKISLSTFALSSHLLTGFDNALQASRMGAYAESSILSHTARRRTVVAVRKIGNELRTFNSKVGILDRLGSDRNMRLVFRIMRAIPSRTIRMTIPHHDSDDAAIHHP